jgi:hypothetical protein
MNWPISRSLAISLLLAARLVAAQQAQEKSGAEMSPMAIMQHQVEQLSAAVTLEETAIESSQRQIEQLRNQISELQTELAAARGATPAAPEQDRGQEEVASLHTEVDKLREQVDLQQSEIAVHEQTKVETQSKFPLKLTGLILMNTFANTSGVDVAQSPALATGGSGSTGLSLRQTVLGLDARGPHVFGATSTADMRVDFFGGVDQSGDGAGYGAGGGFARLRTAHVEVEWDRTRAFVEMDRPIVNPNSPTSLTAIAQPALAWSGNLWNWLPQAGAEHSFALAGSSRFKMQAAIADIPDPANPGSSNSGSGFTALPVTSLAENSRWPGSEARIAYARGDEASGPEVGVGGYFSPHSNAEIRFDAWAATIDYRIPLSSKFEVSGNVYRGAGLGGLGGGAFKDYVYSELGEYSFSRPLDDVGGWTQLKARAGERLEFNTAYGLDNLFAGQLRPYLSLNSNVYQNLARNSTVFTNAIFSPTAYTLFSFEFRRIDSSPALGQHSIADVYGVAAGYRF